MGRFREDTAVIETDGGPIQGIGRVWSEDGRLLASGGGHMIHTLPCG
jgi:hypothetical protein